MNSCHPLQPKGEHVTLQGTNLSNTVTDFPSCDLSKLYVKYYEDSQIDETSLNLKTQACL